MLASIFTIQAIGLFLVLREEKAGAVSCFWVSLLLILLWFDHHVTDSLGLAF